MPFKDLLRARFASAIQSIPAGTWKVLIADSYSQKLLESAYVIDDILRMNVTSVEPLHSPRQPEDVDAIYLLTPTEQNVDRLIADFTGGRKTYKSAHLYFIDGMGDKLADKLTSALEPAGVLQAFVELYCNIQAVEEQVFSLGTPQAFFSMFGTLGGQISADFAMEAFYDDMSVTGRQIINVLATLNEKPYIRYYQPSHHAPLGPLSSSGGPSSRLPPPQQDKTPNSMRWRSAMGGSNRSTEPVGDYLSKKIATRVQEDLEQYMEINPELGSGSERPRGVLFVVDRTMDPVAPFLHEFWYQAMVNDLLTIEDGKRYKYKYENTVGAKETRVAILDEHDEVWMSVRNLHMKDAIDTLMTDFAKFAQENAGFRGNAQNVQMNDLKDMLASLPQFQTQRDQFSLHLDMAQECMNIVQKDNLMAAADVEQCCATGYTAEGKTPKTLVEQMVPLLDDRNFDSWDKVRIIALYILFRDGVADEDRRRLYQHARLSITEQDTINNLVHLGVKVVKDKEKDRFRGSRIKQKNARQEDTYDSSRYKPVVAMMLEDHSSNKLDQHQFPFIGDVPQELTPSLRNGPPQPSASHGQSLRSARPTWHKATSARQTGRTDHQQRYIIFVAGGVTYSEIRQAYILGKMLNKDIYIGSTHIVTPKSFMKDLRSLGRGGIGGNPPMGMPMHHQAPGRPDNRDPGQPMSYQRILDVRHWEPPVGPPPLPQPTPAQAAPSGKKGHHGVHGLNNTFSDLSLTSSQSSKTSKKDGDKEKRKLFKMRWGKD